jgi:hypothetical protein
VVVCARLAGIVREWIFSRAQAGTAKKRSFQMTTEYKTYTVSKVQTGYVFFEEIPDFVSIQESLKCVKVGDRVRLGIDRSNTFGALVSAEIVREPNYVWIAISVAFLVSAFGSLAFLAIGRMDLSAFGVIAVAILLLISEAYKKRGSRKGERS